jgi:dihydropteroate synthase
MGVLNVTPDSFSDGGKFLQVNEAIDRGLEMVEQGADILDVGGESTRPGALDVSISDELQRVIPVITALRGQTDALISVDTRKAEVARQALEAGADILNDVTACSGDEQMAEVCRNFQAGIVLMHMRGEPGTMQDNPTYANVVREVAGYLKDRMSSLADQGIAATQCVLDPGIGFGKTLEHNLALLKGLSVLRELGRPVLVGLSRKRFLGDLTGLDVKHRMVPSIAAMVTSILKGAHIVRVHDVAESAQAAKVVDALKNGVPA